MGINWETGEIDKVPHQLRKDQVCLTLQEMNPGSFAYIDEESLRAGPEGVLWIDPAAMVQEYDEGIEDCYYKVIKVDEGYVVDASYYAISREDDTAILPDYDVDFGKIGWQRVIGMIESDDERQKFERIIYDKYNIVLDSVVRYASSGPDGEV